MYCLLVIVGLALNTAWGLQDPCQIRNVTIMSGVGEHKPLVTPSNCGIAQINVTDLSSQPNVILHSANRSERYSLMLLETKRDAIDVFSLHWLIADITPLDKSLTANVTSTKYLRFSPPNVKESSEFWMLVYSQNQSVLNGPERNEFEWFWPQKWATKNAKSIRKLVGATKFTVRPPQNRTMPSGAYPRNPSHYNPQIPSYPQQPPHYPQLPPHTGYPQQPPYINNHHVPQLPMNQGYAPPPQQQPTEHHHHYHKKNSASTSVPVLPVLILTIVTVLSLN